MNPADGLDAMLAELEEQVQAIRNFQCQHQLERHATRKLARQMIRLSHHWRAEVAAVADTVSDGRCDATAQRVGAADTSGPPSADRSSDACSPAQVGRTETLSIDAAHQRGRPGRSIRGAWRRRRHVQRTPPTILPEMQSWRGRFGHSDE
jgi:hypothetical protein